MVMGVVMGVAVIVAIVVVMVGTRRVMVIVVAVIVVAVIVVVPVIVAVVMITPRMPVRLMHMTMLMGTMLVAVHRTEAVRPALGPEGRTSWREAAAEAFHHRLDDVVAADHQPIGVELRRQVAVAEVPGDADERGRRGGGDRHHVLLRCPHPHDPPILQHQPVAILEHRRLGEIEQERKTVFARHRHAAPVAVLAIEHHRVGDGGGVEGPGRGDGVGVHLEPA